MKGCLRVRDKPSVYEVARLAGVSTATVSRVLAGYERVLPRTRDKVLTAVTELGYVPSGAARDLAARRTGVLGLCFPDLDTEDGDAAYWYDEVIRGMERAARRRGYAVLIAASHHRDDSGLVLSIAGRCDGLVVLARTAKSDILRAMSLLVWPGLLGPLVAPLAGGLITTYLGWEWLFLVNVPLAIVPPSSRKTAIYSGNPVQFS